MRELPDIEDQRGLVSTSQLRTAGWSRSAISRFVRSRGWSPLPGVVYGHRTTLDDDQRVIAGWLWAGPASALTGGWGLVRHGLALAARPVLRRFVVADPCHSRVVDDAEVLHVHHAPTFRNLSGVPVVPLDRALIDYARGFEATADSVRAATIRALQTGLTSPARLEAALGETRPNGTRGIRSGLIDFERGAWSVPEAQLLRILSRRRPRLKLQMNPRLVDTSGRLIGVPDCYLPDHRVAIQVHSWTHHAGFHGARDQWADTVDADARYIPHGIAVLPVSPTVLRDHPERFLRLLDGVLSAQQGRAKVDIRIEVAVEPTPLAPHAS
ncbi:hypothetical protein SAMN06266982_101299 [Propioniciclava tarda]|nr:hypothetical protein SAMN06266982_101299 [Propioniciclava tarda]